MQAIRPWPTLSISAFSRSERALMVSVRQISSAAVITIITAFLLSAQAPPAVRSPEVHADRTITFRLRAPQATAVDLVGEVLQGKGAQPMTKGSDGVWT